MATKEENQYPSGLRCKLEDSIFLFTGLFIFSLVLEIDFLFPVHCPHPVFDTAISIFTISLDKMATTGSVSVSILFQYSYSLDYMS